MNGIRGLKLACTTAFVFLFLLGFATRTSSQQTSSSRPELPLYFEQNMGQAPDGYQFLIRHDGLITLFGPNGLDLRAPKSNRGTSSVQMSWKTRGAGVAEGVDRLPGKSNYGLGNDPHQWHTGIPHFAGIRYAEAFPGDDLQFHGNGAELEQDFIVAPGADPEAISLHFSGAVRIRPNGDLDLHADQAVLRIHPPVAYQEIGGVRREVRAQIAVVGAHEVRFRLGRYDRTRQLIIDPVFVFSSYLAGGGQVTLSCTNLPQYAACSFASGTVSVDSTAVSVPLQITTEQTQSSIAEPISRFNFAAASWIGLLLVMPLLWLLKTNRKFRLIRVATATLALAFLILPIVNCGGGGGGTGTPPVTLDTPAGNYTVNFTATGGGVTRTIPLSLVVQ